MGRKRIVPKYDRWLPFDFLDDEAEKRKEALEKGRNPNPKTDNEKLMDAQARYKLDSDQSALADYFKAARHAAKNFARDLVKKKGLPLSFQSALECAEDAAEELVLELSKPAGSDGMDFYSEKSSVSYLYLRVRTKLFEAADTQAKEIPMSDADLDIYSLKKGVAGLLAFPKGKR
ncbi:MAG: hypothetical protein II814_10150 [Treponema sp.]|nr:hypothetical protein [Treponema sp.]